MVPVDLEVLEEVKAVDSVVQEEVPEVAMGEAAEPVEV